MKGEKMEKEEKKTCPKRRILDDLENATKCPLLREYD